MLIKQKKTALIALISLLIISPSWAQKRINPALPGAKIRKFDKIHRLKKELSPKQKKLSTDLLQLIDSKYLPEGTNREEHFETMKKFRQLRPNTAATDMKDKISEGLVHVYIHLKKNTSITTVNQFLTEISGHDNKNGLVVAWIKTKNLEKIAALEDVRLIRSVLPPITRTGSVVTEGDAIHRTADVRSIYSGGGAGIKVGIISNGVDSRSTAQATGDLPADGYGLTVLSNTQGGEEGTAMLEIVHDMVPDAELYFHDHGGNIDGFNSAIDDLITAGCHVICDDIGWMGEPYFEDGTVASHVSSVLASNDIIFVSACGNDGRSHYQGDYYSVSGETEHDCSHGSSSTPYLYLDMPDGSNVLVVLQWNDQFGSSGNDYDLYLYNRRTGQRVAYSWEPQDGNGNPIEYFSHTSTSSDDYEIIIDKYSGEARTLEVFIYARSGALVYTNNITPVDAIYGHPAANGALAVGAISASDPGNDDIEYFSSHGPVTISFPTPESRAKPEICGIDGVTITGAGGFYNPFYGTSASAPHVAAIAAQVWARLPVSTGNQIRDLITASAVDLGTAGFDYVFGYGRADALNPYIPVITGQSSLSTPEETALTITLDDLIVTDPDNTYPDDFTLTVGTGANYTVSVATITPALDYNGDLTVPVTVNDGNHNSNTFDLAVTVTPANDAPVLSPIGNKSTDENQLLNFTVSASDIEDDDLALTTGTLPTGATFTDNEDGTGDFSWTPAYDQSGIYLITFTVTDNGSPPLDDYEAIQITVNDITYTVNISADIGGSVSPSGDQTADPANTFSVTATPDPCYRFVDWTVSGGVLIIDGDATGEFAVTDNGTITANFAEEIIKGPYLQMVTPSSMVIMWETDNALDSRVDYGQSIPGPGFKDDASLVTIHEIELTGLSPDTKYCYTVTSGGVQSATHTFSTAPATTRPFRFAAYGDNRTDTIIHYDVIQGIISNTPEFVLNSGDLVYHGKSYDEWGPQFFDPAHDLMVNTPMLPILGNHEYSGTGSTLWFKEFFSLSEESDDEWFAFSYGNARFIGLNTNVDYSGSPIKSDQYIWLEAELQSAEYNAATWHFVYFHHPPYTSTYSHTDEIDVQTHLVPLFQQYGVDMVFNGHSHAYERYHHNYIYYIVTGGGGAPLSTLKNDTKEPIREVGVRQYHYCVLDVFDDHCDFVAKMIDVDETVIDEITLYKHTVTFVAGENGSISGNVVQVVKHGCNCTEVEAVADANYHFTGWTGDYTGVTNPLIVENVTSDMTITANFEIDTFTITTTANSNGSIEPDGEVVVDYGDNQSFTITPDANYQVDYVEVDDVDQGAITEYTFYNVTTDHTIEAFFSLIPVISVTFPNGGETFIVSTEQTITWTSQGSVGNVTIEYSSNGGSDWTTIAIDTDNDGSHPWTVTDDVSSNCLVKVSEATDGDPVDMSDAVFTIQFKQLDIPLNSGWSMISFNMDPLDYNVEAIFDGIESLVMVKNNAAKVYMPEYPINTIGEITIQEGYKVYTTGNELLTVEGFPFNDYTTIPVSLTPGWDMIAYLPENAMPIETALQDIAEDITIVKNIAGKTYLPEFNINSIGDMIPGEGYKIHMKDTRSFTYPALKSAPGTIHTTGTVPQKRLVHFTFTENTGNNMTVIVQTAINPLINGSAIENNDEIGVYTPAGLCVGGAVWNGSNIAVTVWGDDDQTPVVDGIKAGDTLQYRLWDASADKEYNAGVTCTSGNPYYSVDGISVLATLQSVEPVAITVTSPNGGEILREGEAAAVTWTSTGTVGNVLIEYTYDNGTNWYMIADNVGNTGSYSWAVPSTLSIACKVRVSETLDGFPVDESDNVFTIDKATPIENSDSVSVVKEQFVVVPNPVNLAENTNSILLVLFTERTIAQATVSIFDAVGNVVATIELYSILAVKQGKRYDLGTWDLCNKNGRRVGMGTYIAILKVTDSVDKKVVFRKIIGVKK